MSARQQQRQPSTCFDSRHLDHHNFHNENGGVFRGHFLKVTLGITMSLEKQNPSPVLDELKMPKTGFLDEMTRVLGKPSSLQAQMKHTKKSTAK